MAKPSTLYILNADSFAKIYGPAEREEIGRLVEVYAPPQTRESIAADPSILHDAEVIFSGWGAPLMDAAFLAAAPRLKAVFYGAGSVRSFVSEALWARGIRVTSAYAANAVPVAEFTLAQILFSLKRGWHFMLTAKREAAWPVRTPVPGAYRSTVGLVSLGMIGRKVCELLRPFDLQLLIYSQSATVETARALGAELCSLEEIFRRADVVSLHTPWLPETEGMITGALIASMKPNATLINTARGGVIREGEMIEVLRQRPDLYALLDVTYPEPPLPGSPLYTLPNVVLTPHIAGSLDNECQRMGRYMVEELQRYLAGEPLRWEITREMAARLA